MANSELKEKWKGVVDESRSSGLTVAESSRNKRLYMGSRRLT